MITVVADTHGTDDHRLRGRTLAAVREADLVIHAGDFTTERVLTAFLAEAGTTAGTGAESTTRTGAVDGTGVEDGAVTESGPGSGSGSGPGAEAGVSERVAGFVAVAGNNDDPAVRDRLARTRVVGRAGIRLVVVHGHEHDETSLSLLGRQENAHVAVVGHSHRPAWDPSGAVAVLNPGSHADPRWNRAAHAELDPTVAGLSGRLVTPGGEVLEDFDLAIERA